MNRFLDALRGYLLALGRVLAVAWKASIKWLSVPVNFCLALLGLLFMVSFVSWAVGSAFEEAVLFFPNARGVLRGELREIPHSRGTEARADLIASEILLGPKNLSLYPAFPQGVRLETVMYRRGRLYVDLSPEAALEDPNSLKYGIAALERSLKTALPGMKRLSLTIGGKEPYAEGIEAEGGKDIKKAGK
jgi:hypothetical protein